MSKKTHKRTATSQAPAALRVAVYVRVSTEEQAQSGLGIEAQITQCAAMATVKGWSAPQVYADPGVSGAKLPEERPAMARLLQDIQAGTIDVLIVSSLDRLGRKAGIVINFVEDLSCDNVKLVSCKESLDTSTPAGQFMLNIFASLAQMERDVTIERTKAALAARGRRDGDKGGRVPFGYIRLFELREVEEKGVRSVKRVCTGLEVDPVAAKVVRRIFALHNRGKSLRAIAADVSTETKKLSHSSVAEIINNRDIYKGARRGESDVFWPVILK